MSKYIDADRLKVVIKQAIRREELNFAALGSGGQTFCINTLEWVLTKIDSLQQEQPDIDLDADIEMEWDSFSKHLAKYGKESEEVVWLNWYNFNELARYFYELGLKGK